MSFQDRKDAAEQLAKKLEQWLEKNRTIEDQQNSDSAVILAIPRGGVVIGDILSSILDVKLDIVVSRKIRAPDNPELAIGAVMPDGRYFLNQDIVDMLKVSQRYIEAEVNAQTREIENRLLFFRGNKDYDNELNDKIVILVDDGIATGSTIFAAAKWINNNQKCRELVVAVPVAPPDIIIKLKKEVSDKVIVLYSPEIFSAVGQFYKNFEQVSDDKVREIMKRHGYAVKN
ncbi:MAG TPA: phosphoribosyltransferase family protein [Nitrososphaeraceae archaeon]|jgi:putative phosphoribosyl transferase